MKCKDDQLTERSDNSISGGLAVFKESKDFAVFK